MKREKLVQLHLNIFEHHALGLAADDYGLPITTYVRLMALRSAKEFLEIKNIDFNGINAIDESIPSNTEKSRHR